MLLLQVKPQALKYSDSPAPRLSPQPDLQVTLEDIPTPCCEANNGRGSSVSSYPGVQGTGPCVQTA